jgi:hypothetical protein
MPFRHEDTSAFEPDDLKILHEVFDLAWQRLALVGTDDEVAEARRRLATCIMTLAKPRALDVPFLLEHCLGQFNQREFV